MKPTQTQIPLSSHKEANTNKLEAHKSIGRL